MAAMAAAEGHIESNCSSVREGTPVVEQTKKESVSLKCPKCLEHPEYKHVVHTLRNIQIHG